MSAMYAAPRATWAVMRLIWMQLLLSLAIIFEQGIFKTDAMAEYFALTYNGVFASGRIWQLLTATLIDIDPLSLLFNLLALWTFGSELEQRWGRRAFLQYAVACALGSAAVFLTLGFYFPAIRGLPYVNATGFLLGLFLAYAVHWPDRQVWFMFLFPIRIKYLLLIVGGLEIVYALRHPLAPFIVAAHLGGLVAAGILLWLSGGEIASLADGAARFWQRLKPKPKGPAEKSQPNSEAKIDEILDKISRDGMKSLSAAEKKFLRDASDRMNRTKH
jgi:membrane associated rhomboid family serine protease